MRKACQRWPVWVSVSLLLHGVVGWIWVLVWRLPAGETRSPALTLRWTAISEEHPSASVETAPLPQQVPLPGPEEFVKPSVEKRDNAAVRSPLPAPSSPSRAWGEALAYQGRPASFFGRGFGGGTVVFVVDISGSMLQKTGTVTRLAEAYQGLMRAVAALGPEQRFNILFFADRVDTFLPEPVPALPETILQAFAYIDSGVDCGGSTNLQEALRTAMAMGPDTLLLLSDGEANTEDEAILAEARYLRRRYCPQLRIHAVGFYLEKDSRAERFLKRLSQEHQGSYTPWNPSSSAVTNGG